MARVHESFKQEFPFIERMDLKKPILFVVDMIHGFINEGALHDKAITACIPFIKELLEDPQLCAIFVRDAHPIKAREFLSFPSHCVIDTKESEVVDELQPYINTVFYKNSTNAFTCPDFQTFLETDLDKYQDIIITGCCTDICILQFALAFNAWLNEHNKEKMRIVIPIDCVDTYHIEGIHDAMLMNEFSLLNMAMNGIHVVSHVKGSI